jgi:hypothetical protein
MSAPLASASACKSTSEQLTQLKAEFPVYKNVYSQVMSGARVITTMVSASLSTELACRPTVAGSTARTVLSS